MQTAGTAITPTEGDSVLIAQTEATQTEFISVSTFEDLGIDEGAVLDRCLPIFSCSVRIWDPNINDWAFQIHLFQRTAVGDIPVNDTAKRWQATRANKLTWALHISEKFNRAVLRSHIKDKEPYSEMIAKRVQVTSPEGDRYPFYASQFGANLGIEIVSDGVLIPTVNILGGFSLAKQYIWNRCEEETRLCYEITKRILSATHNNIQGDIASQSDPHRKLRYYEQLLDIAVYTALSKPGEIGFGFYGIDSDTGAQVVNWVNLAEIKAQAMADIAQAQASQ